MCNRLPLLPPLQGELPPLQGGHQAGAREGRKDTYSVIEARRIRNDRVPCPSVWLLNTWQELTRFADITLKQGQAESACAEASTFLQRERLPRVGCSMGVLEPEVCLRRVVRTLNAIGEPWVTLSLQ